jgi:Concanavalin A-like lectin/glucanases superfamily
MTGEWHHVAWRFTGSASAGYQDILQDGLLYQRFRSKVWYGGPLLDSGGVPNAPVNLLIGRTVANNGAFSGSLSDVRVYNTALDDSAIAAIAASPP